MSDRALREAVSSLEAAQRVERPLPGALFERATSVRIPAGGVLPRSEALLARLHAGGLVPAEKKSNVVDTRRSLGPFMASVDDEPLVVLDACGQIATLTHGFHNPWIVSALHEGRFERCLWSNPDTRVEPAPELDAYAARLRALAPRGLEHVCFVAAGGAEANEKALRIARLHRAGGAGMRRVLALRHSFHGRTLVTLMATWNPAKRAPFEIDGYEAVHVEADLAALERVLDERGHEIYALLVEPMMAEGGDIHLERDFLVAVRRLSRERGIPLVADEVQTGFFTGGDFLWWHRLGLRGADVAPDLVTLAKKAQLGVVLSRWPDPEPASVHVASALRGLVHLEHGEEQARSPDAGALEDELRVRVERLAERHRDLVESPRVAGTTLAFDLPDAKAVDSFIGQRFQRGFMTYPAGERTIRFRLGAQWTRRDLDELFGRIAAALSALGQADATAWRAEGRPRETVSVRAVVGDDWRAVMAIEHEAYEAERRDSESKLRTCAEVGLGLVALDEHDRVVGFCFAVPLEHAIAAVDGPHTDPERGASTTLYSVDIAVAAAARGGSVGRALKRAQLQWARDRGYRWVSGRNKVGRTDAMAAINRAFGALSVARIDRQYGGGGETDYYRIPLLPPPTPRVDAAAPIDLASGIQRPFGPAPGFMGERELVGPTASKLNLSNWATLDSVQYFECLRLCLPRGTAHVYTTSSRDEIVDKLLRCLRLSRKSARIAVGLRGLYVGHTTAAARSLSDPAGFGPDLALFEWPRLPHPADAGVAATIAALDELIERVGAPALFGLFVEPIGERSGLVVGPEDAMALADACRRHALPFVAVETASALRRGGAGLWGIDAWPTEATPDAVVWHPGGQLGHAFVSDPYYVATPLVLISTWDGDELSMIRAHEHLEAAVALDVGPAVAALDRLVHDVAAAVGGAVGGGGLYRSVTCTDATRARVLHEACLAGGVRTGIGLPDTVLLVPPVSATPQWLAQTVGPRLVSAAREAAR